MKINYRKKGFTLMEILIASAIFAGIMVMTVGTFSWAAGYNNRLHETRRVAQSGRAVLADITTQIRLANGSVKYQNNVGLPTHDMNELILLKCDTINLSACSIVEYKLPTEYPHPLLATSVAGDGLIILKKDQNKAIIYRTVQVGATENYQIYKQEVGYSNWSGVMVLPTVFNLPQLFSDSNVSIKVLFSGFGPRDAKTIQPYVEMYLIGQTKDYSTTNPTNRSKFYLKTLTESRDYN